MAQKSCLRHYCKGQMENHLLRYFLLLYSVQIYGYYWLMWSGVEPLFVVHFFHLIMHSFYFVVHFFCLIIHNMQVSNHVASMDDPLVIAALLPPSALLDARNLRWTLCASDRCFKNPVTSAFFKCVKVLPVSRGEGIYQTVLLFD